MKTGLCVFVFALLASSGVLAHRSLKARASASASSTGGSATSVAIASGNGANAVTKTEASDGANVKATTVAESEKDADVNAKTVATGSGPEADSDTTTVVKSDEDIDVSVYVKRVSNGEDVVTVANELVIKLVKSSGAFVLSTFKTGLAEKEKKGELYFKTLELYVQKQGCDAIKTTFNNEELNFLPFKLPEVFYKCIYNGCSGYETAASCCGAAQLKQSQCSCKDGKCLWKQPATQGVYLKYWNCDSCGEKIPYCVCY